MSDEPPANRHADEPEASAPGAIRSVVAHAAGEQRAPRPRRWRWSLLAGVLGLCGLFVTVWWQIRGPSTAEIRALGGTVKTEAVCSQLTLVRLPAMCAKWLSCWRAIHEINLSDKPVTDAHLVRWGKLSRLAIVDLNSTQVTDDGLVYLSGLKSLTKLRLNSTRVTDTGLVHLNGLTNLQELFLDSTEVTDAGLEHLSGLTNLRQLYLDSTQVTDAGLVHLSGLTNLFALTLNSTQITDAGLENFSGLTKLRIVYVRNTRVTDAGVAEFEKRHPRVRIER